MPLLTGISFSVCDADASSQRPQIETSYEVPALYPSSRREWGRYAHPFAAALFMGLDPLTVSPLV